MRTSNRKALFLASSILSMRVMKSDEAGGDTLDNNADGFSLADLADLDLEGIEEVRFESLPKGVYEFEVAEAKIESDAKDGEPRYKIEFGLKILEMLSSIEPGVDLESFAGKTHTERFFIYPKKSQEDAAKAIGRVKAFLADMGCATEGKFNPAVLDSKGHTFRGRIEKQKDRNDAAIEYARLRLDKAPKAA